MNSKKTDAVVDGTLSTMGARDSLFFPNLFLHCRAVVELRCRPVSATLALSSTRNEAFPKIDLQYPVGVATFLVSDYC